MTKKISISIVLILTSMFNQIIACDCPTQPTVKDAIKNSDIVITGKIISKEMINTKDTTTNSMPFDRTEMKYTIVVAHKHKGEFKSDTLTIITGTGGGDCGFGFEVGKKYIIYGSNDRNNNSQKPKKILKNTYWTNICTRTVLYNDKEFQEIKKYS